MKSSDNSTDKVSTDTNIYTTSSTQPPSPPQLSPPSLPNEPNPNSNTKI